jgi:hypothetical protein
MAAFGWGVTTNNLDFAVWMHLVCNTAQCEFEHIPLVFRDGVE